MTAQTKALRDRYKESKYTLRIEARIKGLKDDPWMEIEKGADPQWMDCIEYREKK